MPSGPPDRAKYNEEESMRAFRLLVMFLGLIVFASGPALAAYPEKPVLVIVPFGAGGGNDILLRLLAKYADPVLGQALVVDNKPGAGGQIGWTLAAKATPDGYTLVATTLPSMIMVRELRKNVPFGMDDFRFICAVQSDPIVWLVPPDSPFKTAADVVEFARKNPGKLNVAGDGPQSNVQLQHLLAAKMLGISTNFVSYNGSGPALTALLGKKVDLAAATLSASVQHIDAKRLRPLVIFDEKGLPDLPDAKEALGQDIPAAGLSLRGVAAPKGLPDDVAARLEKAFKEICDNPEFQKQAEEMGVRISYIGGQAVQDIVSKTQAIVNENKGLFE